MTDSSPPGLILAIVSGKGGVGKSTLAVNLAETLSDSGCRVALMDVDLCQTSCATLLNEEPSASVIAAASGAIALDRVPHATASGLTLIVGGSAARPEGIPETFYDALDDALDHAARQHDVVLIDAPAGIDATVRWALDRADAALLVLVGEPTSVSGAYTLAKTVWQTIPEYPFLSVVNAADTNADAAQTTERFAELTTQFLGRAPMPLGWIPYDARVRAAARAQSPVIRTSAPLRLAFAGLATELAPLLPVLNAA